MNDQQQQKVVDKLWMTLLQSFEIKISQCGMQTPILWTISYIKNGRKGGIEKRGMVWHPERWEPLST